MDKLDHYRRIIRQVLEQQARYRPSHGRIEPMLICDAARDQYALIDVGWDRTGRVHSVVVHLHLRQEKIWVEWDGTEPGLTRELLEAGIPQDGMVLAFYRPDRRSLTELAMV